MESTVNITATEKEMKDFFVSESGFSLKQLYEYLENWNGLINENEHLRENDRIKSERQKVLTDVCRCLSLLNRAVNDITALRNENTKLRADLECL